MADFNAHLQQAKSNLRFLSEIREINNYWDWKVTISFYSALHLINAHICKKEGSFYRSHTQTDNAINPNNTNSPSCLIENIYLAYRKLQNYARRSRYLVHENPDDHRTDAFFTYDKHFAKVIRHLNTLINFFENEYNIKIPVTTIKCVHLSQQENLQAFSF